MPLALPSLDQRSWTDLVDEARAIIPRVAPRYTDHNLHDPGITTIHRAAEEIDTELFRVGRLSDAHRRKLLGLLGYPPLAPRPARGVVGVTPAAGAGVVRVPRGSMLSAGRLPFITTAAVHVVPLRIAALQSFDGTQFADVTAAWRAGAPFHPFGGSPQLAAAARPALYVGLTADEPPAAGSWNVPFSLWLETVRNGSDFARIRAAVSAPRRHHSIALAWEYATLGGFNPFVIRQDETRAGTLSGRLALQVQAGDAIERRAIGRVVDSLYYCRAQLVGDQPDIAHELASLIFNAIPVAQAADLRRSVTAMGLPGETLPLNDHETAGASVADGKLRRVVDSGGARWRVVPDFDASTPADRHVTVDATAATVTFGDGNRGRTVPPGGVDIRHFATMASAGNLGASDAWRVVDEALAPLISRVANATMLRGGADAEGTASAAARAAEDLWAHERLIDLSRGTGTLDQLSRDEILARHAPARATTPVDCERLALDVPGTYVARARAWVGIVPGAPCVTDADALTLVIVPAFPSHRPEPSRGLLRAVRRFLDQRRVLGTRLFVRGPRYRTIAVRARLSFSRDAESGVAAARAGLHRFLHPLTGGPDGNGWPFGRDVYRNEVLALLDRVPGVQHVTSLEIVADDAEASCGNICVAPCDLVVSGAHDVEAS